MGVHEYRIIEKMATGSFGVVFKVRRTLDNEILVMKRIPLEELSEEERRSATQEMLVMSGLHHPYIVAQRDAFLFNGNDLCLIMDYYDGGDLDLAIARRRDADAYFDLEEIMLWFSEMTLALQYLHANGIVHRDMKTHNLFLSGRANTIAVGDFGIAERIDSEKATHAAAAAVAAAAWRQQPQRSSLPRRWSASSAGGDARSGEVPHPAQRTPGLSQPRPHAQDEDSSTDGTNSTNSPDVTAAYVNRGSIMDSTLLPPDASSPACAAGGGGDANSRTDTPPFASAAPRQQQPHSAAMKGTPMYMAPEALQGEDAAGPAGMGIGPASDMWSLGCILYELLCLRHPFESRDIGALVMRVTRGLREPLPPHYPPEVRELVDDLLMLDPRQRPTCGEVLQRPLVRAYLRRLRALYVPRGPPSSLDERALTVQLQQFLPRDGNEGHRGEIAGTPAATAPASFPSTPSKAAELINEAGKISDRGDDTGNFEHDYRYYNRRATEPRCPPSVEREGIEQRRRVAARQAAASMMRMSGSMHSSTARTMVVNGGGDGGSGGTYTGEPGGALMHLSLDPLLNDSNAGTFFAGGTSPFSILADGAMPVFHPGRSKGPASRLGGAARTPGTPGTPGNGARTTSGDVDNNDDDDGCSVVTSRSLQKGSLAPISLSKSSACANSAPSTAESHSGAAPARPARGAAGQDEGNSDSPPTAGPRQDRAPSPSTHGVKKLSHVGGGDRRRSDGGPPPTWETAARRLKLDGAAAAGPFPRRASSLKPSGEGRPTSASFLTADGETVEDLFFRQHANVRDMRDAPLPAIAQEVVRLRLVLQACLRERQRRRDARGLLYQFGDELIPTMPVTFRALTESDSAARHAMHGPAGEAPTSSDGGVPLSQHSPYTHLSQSTAVARAAQPVGDARWPSVRAEQRAAQVPLLAKYLARRADIAHTISEQLAPDVFASVYAYYAHTNLVNRDPAHVMRLVPQREKWAVLPLVEDVVVLDRFLEGSLDSDRTLCAE